VRVQALITERHVDQIADGVDLAFRVGVLKDVSLVNILDNQMASKIDFKRKVPRLE
jgi:hypothetical protein